MKKNILAVGRDGFLQDVGEILLNAGYVLNIAFDDHLIEEKISFIDNIIIEFDFGVKHPNAISIIQKSEKPFFVVSSDHNLAAVLQAKNWGAKDFIAQPYNKREFIARLNAVVEQKARISCIGGGTGLFTLLMGLKALPNVLLTSIVSMSDDGGSSGRLKASFGILPPGDIRRSLVALSNAPVLMNEMMQYRFDKGDELKGHSLGNLFLTALTEIKGSISEAIRSLGDVLHIQGVVLPVTTDRTTLSAEFEDGMIVKGENKIDLCEGRASDLNVKSLWHEPETEISIDAYSSIINSDIIIFGPGDLYTSIITNFLVNNIKEAISESPAKKVYICNLMTKPGETANFDADQHIEEIVKYLGRDCLDYVIASSTNYSQDAVDTYAKKDQCPVNIGDIDKIRSITQAQIIEADVGDLTHLVRHDCKRITQEINQIIRGL